MKRLFMSVLIISLAFMLAACGGDDSGNKTDKESDNKSEEASTGKVEITDKEKVESDKVVLKVNGNKIKGKRYNTMYAQTKIMMSQFGQDVSNKKKLKKQTLGVIINQELLRQDAKKKGIKVSDKKVQQEFEKAKSGSEDQFQAMLERYHLTEQTFKKQLKSELLVQKYMEKVLADVKISDKEAKDFYSKLKKQQDKLPELDKIKGKIKEKLKQQKETQQLQKKIEELKKQAEIKRLI